MPKLCEGISEYLATKVGDDASPPLSVLIREKRDRGLDRAFAQVQEINACLLPSSTEILLIPGLLVAVLVHLPIQAMNGHAVPLGFVSIDATVVTKAEQLLQEVTHIALPTERVTEESIDIPE